MTFLVTPAHADIFAALEDPRGGNIQISAVAGAGKTSTIVEALKRVRGSVRFLVFNKRNAEELTTRVPAHVQVQTLNALGFRAINARFRACGLRPRLDGHAVEAMVKRALADDEFRAVGSDVTRTVRLAKAAGIFPADAALPAGLTWVRDGLMADTLETWLDLIDHHGIEPEGGAAATVAGLARKVLRGLAETIDEVIDFDDQLGLAVGLGCHVERTDWTFVDEAQDLSPLQHALVRLCAGGTGRVVAVGDERQAIYGWRGAANDSMARMAADLRMRSLPLHVSYRCPRAVVAVAQRYVSHIQAHDAAPMGSVVEEAKPVDEVGAQAGDMVLCRTTAPVVRTAWALLRAGTPAVVLGRDIGAGIHALVKRLRPKDLADLEVRLSAWLAKECEKAEKADDPARKESAEDRAATVRVFAGMVETLEEMRAKIDETFKDAKTDTVVTCCTIHKAKGLEAERVFILDWHKMPPKWATKDWQMEQETNLQYVAVTRAKSHLQFALSPARDEAPKTATPTSAPTRWVLLTGNTFPVKDVLRESYGARVTKSGDKWLTHVPAERASDAQALVYEVAGSNRRATRRYRRW